MSLPPDSFPPAGSAAPATPSTGEFTTAWIAYGCFAVGILLWWPMLVGLIIGYVRRGEPDAGFIDSHYRWLIRTFWWSSVSYIAMLAVIIAGAWPLLRDILAQVNSGGPVGPAGDWGGSSISFAWGSLFATVGAATAGGIGLAVVWFWLIYRVIRGGLRLANAQPAP